jgi:hypothetical protein
MVFSQKSALINSIQEKYLLAHLEAKYGCKFSKTSSETLLFSFTKSNAETTKKNYLDILQNNTSWLFFLATQVESFLIGL